MLLHNKIFPTPASSSDLSSRRYYKSLPNMGHPVHAAMVEDLGSVLEVTALAFEFLILLVEDDVLVFSPPSLLSSFLLMSSCLLFVSSFGSLPLFPCRDIGDHSECMNTNHFCWNLAFWKVPTIASCGEACMSSPPPTCILFKMYINSLKISYSKCIKLPS